MPAVFATTHWSVVLAAGHSSAPGAQEALEKLCRAYWYPLYVYVRRQGNGPQDAQDLTQDFFSRLLEKKYLAMADRARGKFRTFLLGSLKNFLVNEWRRAGRLKRGGDLTFVSFDANEAEERYAGEPIDETNSTNVYERQWAVALIEQVFSMLRGEYAAAGKAKLFEALRVYVWGEGSSPPYSEIGPQFNLTQGAAKMAVSRLRQRFRELLRGEVAHTVARPEDIDGELRHLIAVLKA